jgi:hypothetical protein
VAVYFSTLRRWTERAFDVCVLNAVRLELRDRSDLVISSLICSPKCLCVRVDRGRQVVAEEGDPSRPSRPHVVVRAVAEDKIVSARDGSFSIRFQQPDIQLRLSPAAPSFAGDATVQQDRRRHDVSILEKKITRHRRCMPRRDSFARLSRRQSR